MPEPTDREVVAARGPRNAVDPRRAYAAIRELELSPRGRLEPTATLFLTNRECPFRCTMCDLWRNTTERPVTPGEILEQIDVALADLSAVGPSRSVKLYNSGNFFDAKAIPPAAHAGIAERVAEFETVVVENHPRLTDGRVLAFRDRLAGELEVALGLETAHPKTLRRLNKRMTVADYDRAAAFLVEHGIAVRTFVLVGPPFIDPAIGPDWTIRSAEQAFAAGSRVVSLVPTRTGNGIMDRLAVAGDFREPTFDEIEAVAERLLPRSRGQRLFVDTWDAERFLPCPDCRGRRIARMETINRTQTVPPPIACGCQP